MNINDLPKYIEVFYKFFFNEQYEHGDKGLFLSEIVTIIRTLEGESIGKEELASIIVPLKVMKVIAESSQESLYVGGELLFAIAGLKRDGIIE